MTGKVKLLKEENVAVLEEQDDGLFTCHHIYLGAITTIVRLRDTKTRVSNGDDQFRHCIRIGSKEVIPILEDTYKQLLTYWLAFLRGGDWDK